jgi:hypothetical protein
MSPQVWRILENLSQTRFDSKNYTDDYMSFQFEHQGKPPLGSFCQICGAAQSKQVDLHNYNHFVQITLMLSDDVSRPYGEYHFLMANIDRDHRSLWRKLILVGGE